MSQTGNKEIYSYGAPWPVYGMNWSCKKDKLRLGFGSFLENYQNKLQIIQLDEKTDEYVKIAEVTHNYPTTKLLWTPYNGGLMPDLFATTSEYLRIWELSDDVNSEEAENEISLKATLANIRKIGPNKKDFCAPLTSFDWNEVDPSMIVTSSIDTTCTIWDINTQQAKTQLIAHDKEVYDVAFSNGVDIFASVGADGSVRMFDLRALEHSTIIYETSTSNGDESETSKSQESNMPLLRLSWNKQDPNYIATFQMNSSDVIILDIRVPAVPVSKLHCHKGNINSITWSPQSRKHLCSAGDDGQAYIWDISQIEKGRKIEQPILSYQAGSAINQVCWNASHPEWIGINYDDHIQVLKV
ncbi:WD40 repeat-like protein [Piromyces finnis]|uniref:WD40 repeat-like protein n=1 Tax=Piromyces finnis TaxID=1754191 RepID=A0A1Y1VNJ0_9FUNG|nr:WD40 repeat-like protein [Piromyces finnis]|eukprot:ORX60974.1 WD40 repeat-like protein [Piromyces finnis]